MSKYNKKSKENKKDRLIGLRLTKEEYQDLSYMMIMTDRSASEMVRYCIHKVFSRNEY